MLDLVDSMGRDRMEAAWKLKDKQPPTDKQGGPLKNANPFVVWWTEAGHVKEEWPVAAEQTSTAAWPKVLLVVCCGI